MNSIIEPIRKIKTVCQKENRVKYFKPVTDDTSRMQPYKIVANYVSSLEATTLFIASTGGLHDEIIDSIYEIIEREVKVYIIIKSFDDEKARETLIRFDNKRPAIAREVPELNNNFITFTKDNVVDGILSIHPMDSERLKLIKLKKEEAQDLSYWFKYLFWNKAEKEKILENISAPKESPFPPFLHSKNSVEYINKEHDSTAYKSIIVPPDKKNYQSYAEKYNDFMISQETVTPVYINNETTQIGSLKLHRNILKEMGNHYQLTEDELQNIESPYIAFDFDSWTQSRKIIKEEKVKIPDQIAHTIEEMKNTIPDFFTPRPSTLNIEYEWQVLPPEPSKEAKFANLYDEYNVLEKTFHNDAEKLKKILSSIIENKSRFASFFSGANRKASERLKQIENWQTGPLRNMPYNDVLDMFIAGGKWETFYNEVSSSKQDFETGLKEKEAQDKWEKEKKDKDDSLIRCKKELNDLSEEIRVKKERMNSDIEKKELAQNSLENDTDHSPEENLKKDDKKSKENEKIGKSLNEGTLKQCKKELKILREELKKYQYDSDKKIRNKEKEIESLENTLEQQYKNFSYKTAQNELSYLKKGKNGSHIKLSTYTLPEYALPEVGELYEDNQNYYLCIDYHEELKQANEIASGRYVKKPCKVVVKRTRI